MLTTEHKAKDDHLIAQLRIALGEDLSKMSQALHVELDSMIKREIKKMQASLLDSIKHLDRGAHEKMAEQSDKTAATLRSLRQEVDAGKGTNMRLTALVEESQRAQRHLTARLEMLEAQRPRQHGEAAEGTQRGARGGNRGNYSIDAEMASPSVRRTQCTDSQDHHRQNEESGSQRPRNDGYEPGDLRRSRSNVCPQEQGALQPPMILGLRAPPNAPRPSGLRMPPLPPFLQSPSNDPTSSARRWHSNHGNMPAGSHSHLVSGNQSIDDAAGGSRAKRLRRNEEVKGGCDSCDDDVEGGATPFPDDL